MTGGGADVDSVGREDASEAVVGKLEEGFALKDGQELFGFVPARQRPQPRAGAAGHDDAILHGE